MAPEEMAPEAPSSEPPSVDDPSSDDAPPEDEGDTSDVDNLAVIQGIGPKMAFRLREAGVHTFDDLAQKTPDAIRDMMGGLPSFANVDSWIEQAADLADDDS